VSDDHAPPLLVRQARHPLVDLRLLLRGPRLHPGGRAMTALTVTVPGVPVGQGRLSSLGRGRMVHSNADKLLPWRQSVAWHTRQEMAAAGITEPLTGPLKLTATFVLPRPKSAPKRRWAPDGRPDLSHLLRALEDAITQSGLIVDDGQFVHEEQSKVYPADGALPGVTFTVAPAERGTAVAA
jgi:crossover junction endodeoxyribonuclease RusA